MTIHWGIIGCGNVCEVKSGPGLQEADGSELVAVMRRDGDKAADYAHRHGVGKWTTGADALITDPDVDAVYIATPPGDHCDYALRVAAAGKPCYVEKPIARNYSECLQMIEAFAAAGQSLFVAYYRRALPRFLKARELISGGAIGQVTGVSYRFSQSRDKTTDPDDPPWRVVAERAGGGYFLDLGSHTLDILDFLLGPLTGVSGSAANVASPYDTEDVVAMHFTALDGAAGTASWNFAAGVGEDIIEITGDKGRVALSCFGNDPVRVITTDAGEAFDLPDPPHVQQPLIQTIVDDLLGRGRCESTGESAARTSRVMDEVLRGYYGTREDGFWIDPSAWPGRQA